MGKSGDQIATESFKVQVSYVLLQRKITTWCNSLGILDLIQIQIYQILLQNKINYKRMKPEAKYMLIKGSFQFSLQELPYHILTYTFPFCVFPFHFYLHKQSHTSCKSHAFLLCELTKMRTTSKKNTTSQIKTT